MLFIVKIILYKRSREIPEFIKKKKTNTCTDIIDYTKFKL